MKNLSVLGVGAILNKDDKFLILQEKLNNKAIGKEADSYGFPMGHVKANEGVVDAVIREVREETGLTISIVDIVGFYDLKSAFGIVFRCELASAPKINLNEGEIKTFHWLTQEELADKRLRPAVREALLDFEKGVGYDLDTISII